MRKMFALVAVAMLLASGWALFPGPVLADDEDPDIEGKIFGPWNITTTKSYKDMTIEVTGNITIESGGELLLDNVTLIMNSSISKEHYLVVQSGGNLEITNGSVVTNNATQDRPYYMIIEDGGSADIDGSTLRRMGNLSFGQTFTFNYSKMGLLVQSNSVSITNNLIEDGYAGCMCTRWGIVPIAPTITGNTFQNNLFGVGVTIGCNPTLGGNDYRSNGVGIGDFLRILSTLTVEGEHFDGNDIAIGAYTAMVNVKDSVIENSSFVGIGGFGNSVILADNVTFRNNTNATYADATAMTIGNSHFENSIDHDFFVDNGSKVDVVDSWLDRRDGVNVNETGSLLNNSYHVDVKVEYLDGSPVPGAVVNVTTVQGTQAFNTATDANGDAPTLKVVEFSDAGEGTVFLTPHNFTAEKGAFWNRTQATVNEAMALVLVVYERDLLRPDISISTPENGTHFATPIIQVEGSAGDNKGVAFVEVSIDGANWTNATGTTSWSSEVVLPEDGAYDVCARAWDTSDNNMTACVEVVLDSVPPSLTVSEPSEGGYFNHSQLFVKGYTDADLLTVNGEDVTVFQGGFSYAITLTKEGANDIVVVASDLAGNTNASTVTVFRDLIPPSISVLSPSPDSTVAELSIVVAGNVTDSQGVTSMRASVDNVTWKAADINFTGGDNRTGAFTVALTLVEGENTVHLEAMDRASNHGIYVFNLTVDLPDLVPPDVAIVSPSDGDRISGLSLLVEGTASDDEGLAKVEVSIDNATWKMVSTTDDFAHWVVNISLVEGNNTIYARATDDGGNTAMDKAKVHATRPFADDEPPVVAVTSHRHNQVLHKRTVTISGTVSDNHEVRSVSVSLTGAGADAQWVMADVNEAAGTWSTEVTLADGWNEIAVKAVDESLNENTTIVAIKYEKKVGEGFNWMYLWALVIIFIVLAVVYMATLPGRQRARMAGDGRRAGEEGEEGSEEE
jgi:hypothetical protein